MEENFPTITFEEKYTEEARVNPDLRQALDLLDEAGQAHRENEIESAIEFYRKSLAFHPTADAHTYLGWMYSIQERYGEAIEECKQAIEVDEEFGNPYNDIGCYLMRIGEEDESVEWFERAKQARRYEPRHFPYLNVGRHHLKRGAYGKAVGELYQALRRSPEDASLRRQVCELIALIG